MLKSTGPIPTPSETPKVKQKHGGSYDERAEHLQEQANTRTSRFTEALKVDHDSRNDASRGQTKVQSQQMQQRQVEAAARTSTQRHMAPKMAIISSPEGHE